MKKEISEKRMARILCGILAIMLIGLAVISINMYLYAESQTIGFLDGKPYLISTIIEIATIPLTIIIYKSIIKQNDLYSELEKYLIEELSHQPSGDINGQATGVQHSKRDIISLMVDNAHRIKNYFIISIVQEIVSYIISVFCAVSGVAIIIYSIFVVLSNSNVEAAILSIISGSTTEAVAGIVLWIHNKSSEQLNYYYKALHENEKLLSAINLADKLRDDTREQMYMEIIKAQIRENKGKEEKS